MAHMAVGRLLSLVRRHVEFTSCQNVYVILLLVLLVLVSSSENILLLRVVYPSQSESELCFGDDALYKTTFYIPIFTTGPGFGPGDIVLERGTQQPPPNFRPMYCGQAAGWIKAQLVGLRTEVGLGTRHIVLEQSLDRWGPSLLPPRQKKGQSPQFWPMSVVAKGLDQPIKMPLGAEV